DDAHNQQLSTNRAKAVYNYLIENKIPSDRISFKGYGESKPVATNSTEAGKQQNRRVEFLILEN
ncbi:MAG TPA: OmpA family protein, partial [Cyclobacteriaceae bacterium]|nr:OmpA family protein [Cyclobacteriaceae bacterium]